LVWGAARQATTAQTYDQYSFREDAFLEDLRFVCFLLGAAIIMLGNASDGVVFTSKIIRIIQSGN